MPKGDRANLERLLRTAWEKQTALLAKSPIPEGKPKTKLRLDFSLTLVVFMLSITFVLFPPTTRLWAATWIIILSSMAIYPILHFWDWILKNTKHAKVCTFASVLLMGGFLFNHLRPVFYPPASLFF